LKKQSELGVLYSQNRDVLQEAWEIFQSYQGMPWETARQIDIIYAETQWMDNSENLYSAIVLDRTDVMVAKGFLRKR